MPKAPTRNDYHGWIVLDETGAPLFDTLSDRRSAAVDAACQGDGKDWPDLKRIGYRVVKVRLEEIG